MTFITAHFGRCLDCSQRLAMMEWLKETDDDIINRNMTRQPSGHTTGSEHRLIIGNTVRAICLVLSIGGILLGVVLTKGYYDHVVEGRVTGCAITTYIDCDKVSSSSFSTIAGVPLSVYGFGYHLFLLGLLLPGFAKRFDDYSSKTLPLVQLASAAGALVSVALAFISLVVIKALCIYCTALQIVNVAIFIIVLLRIREWKPGQEAPRRPSTRMTLLGLKNPRVIGPAIVLAVAAAGSFFLMYGMGKRDVDAAPGATGAAAADELINLHFGEKVHEITTEDSPSLGSNELGFQIIVFSDYNCTHCKDTDDQLQRLVAYFDGKIELVFKFFPLDNDCNPFIENSAPSTSCEAAAAACEAYEQGMFWEYHNKLFENYQEYSRARLVEYAEDVGIPDLEEFQKRMDDEFVERRLYLDILKGVVAEVRYTPTVLLNGRRIKSFRKSGDSRYELLKDTIEELIGQRGDPR